MSLPHFNKTANFPNSPVIPIYSSLFQIYLPGIVSDLNKDMYAFEINNQQLLISCYLTEKTFTEYLQQSKLANIININIGNKTEELIINLMYKVAYVGYKFSMNLSKSDEICNIIFEYKIIRDVTLELPQ